jgi:hypothetical protein
MVCQSPPDAARVADVAAQKQGRDACRPEHCASLLKRRFIRIDADHH